MNPPPGEDEPKVWDLNAREELRIEIEAGTDGVALTLTRGTAEIFGSELASGHTYTLSGPRKLAVFTWTGAGVVLLGRCHAYVGTETPMPAYLQQHTELEALRLQAEQDTAAPQGPRVLLAGPSDVGKTSLARMLVNWAARLQRAPVLLDLDVGAGLVVPGAVGAARIYRPMPFTGETLEFFQPVLYYYGSPSASTHSELYRSVVETAAISVEKMLLAHASSGHAGVVIDTCAWSDSSAGYELLKDVIDVTSANVLLVLDSERLYNDLRRDYGSNPTVRVVRLAKSGGIIASDSAARLALQKERVGRYFYGPSKSLHPHTTTLAYQALRVYEVGAPMAPDSVLPLGAERTVDAKRVVPVLLGPELLFAVLAVSYSKTESDLLSTNIAGFVVVQDIDYENKMVSLLLPCAGVLPNSFMLKGSIKWTS